MHWTPFMSDRPQVWTLGFLPSTVGMLAIAPLLAIPMSGVADTHPPRAHGVTVVDLATSATHRSSTLKSGLLREDISTLISNRAKSALGSTGVHRLQNFLRLQAGWDGQSSKPIDLRSVAAFSDFFAETGLQPDQLGVFMSAQGNVVVNWPDRDGQLVELEFQSSELEYFIERNEEEGSIPNSSIEHRKLLERLLG